MDIQLRTPVKSTDDIIIHYKNRSDLPDTFRTHKSKLVALSGYFARMFRYEYKETCSHEVELHEDDSAALDFLFEFLGQNEPEIALRDHVAEMATILADPDLFRRSGRFRWVRTQHLNLRNLYVLTDKYDMAGLQSIITEKAFPQLLEGMWALARDWYDTTYSDPEIDDEDGPISAFGFVKLHYNFFVDNLARFPRDLAMVLGTAVAQYGHFEPYNTVLTDIWIMISTSRGRYEMAWRRRLWMRWRLLGGSGRRWRSGRGRCSGRLWIRL